MTKTKMRQSQTSLTSDFAETLEEYRETGVMTIECWNMVRSYVNRVARKQYEGQRLFRYKAYIRDARTSYFFVFLLENSHRSARWCITTWRIRKAIIELIITLEFYGVSIFPEGDSFTQKTNRKICRDIISVMRVARDNNLRLTDIVRIRELVKNEGLFKKYERFVLAAYPWLSEERDTRSKPKRTYKEWD